MPLAGAVVVPGNLVVQSNVKAIQHPTGGVVAEIKADNGKRVAAGDLLLRLDPTQAQASLQTVSKQLDEFRAKIARLTAERDGLEQPEFPAELTSKTNDDNVRGVLTSEIRCSRLASTPGRARRISCRAGSSQLNDEITGLEAQSVSKTKQIELINGELTGVQDLYDKRLVPLTRLTTLQREAARIDGERGQLVSSIAETKSKIGEAQLQIVKVDQDFRTEVVKDLGEAQAKEGELVEKRHRGARPARPDRDARADVRRDPPAQRAYRSAASSGPARRSWKSSPTATISRSRPMSSPRTSTMCARDRRRSSASRHSTSARPRRSAAR